MERDVTGAAQVQSFAVPSQWLLAWQQAPISERARDDQHILGVNKQSWRKSGAVWGYRTINCDPGESCGKHRVARLMKPEGLCSKTGYGPR